MDIQPKIKTLSVPLGTQRNSFFFAIVVEIALSWRSKESQSDWLDAIKA